MSHEFQTLRTLITHLLPPTWLVRLTGMTMEPEYVLLQVTTTAQVTGCPRCAVPSSTVHSRYQRRLMDLPWGTRPVRLQLTVRKFVCRNLSCPRRIFTERVPGLVAPYARKTPHSVSIRPCPNPDYLGMSPHFLRTTREHPVGPPWAENDRQALRDAQSGGRMR
jgi:hypothetical protein